MRYELPTTIASVTVYPDRALVTRAGAVAVEEPGEHLLRITGLPSRVNRDSLRASGRGPAGTRILGIEEAPEYHATPPEEQRRSLEDDIRRLERELALLDERRKIYDEQRGWLNSLAEHTARSLAWGMTRGTAKTEDASAFFTYASDEAQRVAAARQEVERERDETARLLEARRRELHMLGAGQQPDRLTASVRISVASPGRVELTLSYLIGGATWRPRYDARVDEQRADLHLTQQALISQQTGEDWMGVPLALSTARPAASHHLPDDLDPWYVDAFDPLAVAASPATTMPRMAAPMRALSLDLAPTGAPAAEAAPLVQAELASAQVERSGSVQVFHVAGGDVPTDGAPHVFTIGEYGLPCRMDYVAMPELAPGAQRRARGRNVTGQVLLPGLLHIFAAGPAGDEYTGSSTLELTAENADLTLYLGVDDNVTVKRELIERDTDKGSLLQSGIRRITFGYRVTIGNRTDERQRVVLKDRLPVPRHERIKLKVLDLKPQPAARTRLEQLAWELDIAAGEERRVEWRFVVEAPADLDLTGLP